MRALLVTAIVLLSACAAPQAGVLPSQSIAPTETTYAKPTVLAVGSPPALALSVRALTDIPGQAVASPDGKWIAAPRPAPGGKVSYVPALLLFDSEGKRLATVDAPGGAYSWSWLSDSSGLYVALDAPQRASELGVAELDGTVTKTGLQFAHPLLSHDGTWIVAEHQEGCCASIEQKEIWIAPRHGGTPRVLARTSTNDRPQPIALLGVDQQDRVVYRDGDAILRVSISSGATSVLASGAEFATTLIGGTSPDGFAMVIRGYEPPRWYALRDDAVIPWNDTAWGAIVEERQGVAILFGTRPLWYDGHTLLTSTPKGLFIASIGEGNNGELGPTLSRGDLALALARGRIAVARDRHVIVIDLTSGREGDTGIDIGTDSSGVTVSPLPSRGFIVSTALATYRID